MASAANLTLYYVAIFESFWYQIPSPAYSSSWTEPNLGFIRGFQSMRCLTSLYYSFEIGSHN